MLFTPTLAPGAPEWTDPKGRKWKLRRTITQWAPAAVGKPSSATSPNGLDALTDAELASAMRPLMLEGNHEYALDSVDVAGVALARARAKAGFVVKGDVPLTAEI